MSDDRQFGPRTPAVTRFLEGIRGLTLQQWREVIAAWRTTVTDSWHEADSAVAAAVAQSDRRQAREELLNQLEDIMRRMRWDVGAPTADTAETIERSSAHYIASLAALALLVGDRITRREFDALYFPFRGVIPLATITDVLGHATSATNDEGRRI